MPTKEAEIARLSEESQTPGFWDDQRAAQVSMRRLTTLQGQVDQWRDLTKRAADLDELWSLRWGKMTKP